jgi:hypothetical protein
MKTPPRIALALLQRHASGELIGDLTEGHLRGRSRLWFWRQTVFALALIAVNEARAHKLFTLRGVVVGGAVCAFVAYPVIPLIRVFLTDVAGLPFMTVYDDAPERRMVLVIAEAVLASCVVGRAQQRAPLASVTAFTLMVVAPATLFTFAILRRVVVYDWVTHETRRIDPLLLTAFPVALALAMLVAGVLASRRTEHLVSR